MIDKFREFFSYSFRDFQTSFIVGLVSAFILGTILFVVVLGWKKGMKWWHILLIGLCFSLLIELLQLFLKRGLTEFDDVVHNVVGCMIGYWVLIGCRKVVASYSDVRI